MRGNAGAPGKCRRWIYALAAASLTVPFAGCSGTTGPGDGMGRLAVSENHHFFVDESSAPFFWLADTAWSLPLNLDRAETIEYLDTRAEQGYNVIQTVAIFPQAGGPGPNRYGDNPFGVGLDDLRVTEGSDPGDPEQYDYWDHLDFVVDAAADRGLRVALAPVWASAQVGELISEDNAARYGEFVGARYADDEVIWVLGGDASADGVEDVWRELARGIAIGATRAEDYSTTLMTYHPIGDRSSAHWFHNDYWLDFNMIQGGHCLHYEVRQKLIDDSWMANPPKPFLDGEPLYSGTPYCPWELPHKGNSTPLDVRKDAYWSVFGGAAGVTYGHNSVWQFLSDRRPAELGARGDWRAALDDPAGRQMRHLRALMESRPFISGEPAADVVTSDLGVGATRIQATRATDGAYLMVYVPDGRPFDVSLDAVSGDSARGWWFNPRTGEATEIGSTPTGGQSRFTPPSGEDWVLVLDDAARVFPAPGSR